MATKKSTAKAEEVPTATSAASEIASAIRDAIESGKPVLKKTPFNRKKQTPWSPPEGTPRLKLKRKIYHHALLVGERVSNDEIALMNKLRPGVFCNGYVKVIRRRDKGLDIDYPVKTSSQRLKLINEFGIRDFKELLERLVHEGENPKKLEFDPEADD